MSKNVVFTAGTFDLFHAGHVNLLFQCRKIAGPDGTVVVSVNEDEFVRRFKGNKPIVSYNDRAAVLASCRYVDRVIPNVGGFNLKETLDFYTNLVVKSDEGSANASPDFIVVGSDWAKKDYYAQIGMSQTDLDRRLISLIYVPYTENISSTQIKETAMNICHKIN